MPKVLPYRDWEAIREDYCSGTMTSEEIAQKWRVKASTLRTRAVREEWPTPGRFKQHMDKAVKIASEAVMQGFRGSEEPGSPEDMAMRGLQPLQQATSGVPDSLGQPASGSKTIDTLAYQQAMAQFACRAVTSGFSRMKPPSNWREMATADTIARRALGLDSKGGASAAAMIRVTGANGQTVDVAAMAQADGGGDWEDEEDD